MNNPKFEKVLNLVTDTILDRKEGDVVYARRNGAVVAARIIGISTSVVFNGVEQYRDQVSTNVNLELATGDAEHIDNYSEYKENSRLYASIDDCIHNTPIKEAKRGHIEFAQRLYKAYGMTPNWRDSCGGRTLTGCDLYIKRPTKVDKTAYNGFIYEHGNVEGVCFTTEYFHRAGDSRDYINGSYEYLNTYYNLYATEQGAYDALKPKIIEFPTEEKKTSQKSKMRAEIEMWLHELAENICVFGAVQPPVSLIPVGDEKRGKNLTAIAVTLQASDEPCVLTTEGEVVPLQDLSEDSVTRIYEFVKEDYNS